MGIKKLKNFFLEQQSYGIVMDNTGFHDLDELIVALKNELSNHTSITNDELNALYKDHLSIKKLADPYFPTIVTAIGLGIPMHDTI